MGRNNRGPLVVLGILVLVLLPGPALMGGMMGTGRIGPGMMGWGWGYTTGAATTGNGWVWGLGMALGGPMMLAFWGALIVCVVLLARWATGSQHQSDQCGRPAGDPAPPLRSRRNRSAVHYPRGSTRAMLESRAPVHVAS
jgi:hypothetical protein